LFLDDLRAVKQHLAKSKSPPAHYNPTKAKEIYNFIDEGFIPTGQYSQKNKGNALFFEIFFEMVIF